MEKVERSISFTFSFVFDPELTHLRGPVNTAFAVTLFVVQIIFADSFGVIVLAATFIFAMSSAYSQSQDLSNHISTCSCLTHQLRM